MKPKNKTKPGKARMKPETQAQVAAPLHRFVVRVRWHARKAGGLFVGIRVSFPASILFDNGEVRPSVGLLVATVDMEFRGRVTSTHNEKAEG
ncbi:MAG: hypothetical protein WC364_11915 [Eubacteriales bacterium]